MTYNNHEISFCLCIYRILKYDIEVDKTKFYHFILLSK
jgi:hypothetical protein